MSTTLRFMIYLILTLLSFSSWAWGRRGHEIVGTVAAYLTSEEDGAAPLRNRSYDIGYYSNVPDFQWKYPPIENIERPEHYMDLEAFERGFKAKPEIKHPFTLSRKDFEKMFPEIPLKAGRAYWRIQELSEKLNKIALRLKGELPLNERHALQGKWLVTAGVMAHYVGDLSMPLHLTEHNDGQTTNQQGIHSYYEWICVDELYPNIQVDVMETSRKKWPSFHKANADKAILEMLEALANQSAKQIPKMLAIDKKNKRDNRKVTCGKFKEMILQGLTSSSLVLAELFHRSLGWKFNDEKFFFFDGKPDYISPGHEESDQLTRPSPTN